jgi:hypothetical protein
MKLSNETQLLNLLLACFKKLRILLRAVYELDIQVSNEHYIKPDLICFIENQKRFYSIFEFKKRSNIYENDIEDNIKPQHTNYLLFRPQDLDSSLIPKVIGSPSYLNYLFHSTPNKVISTIINSVPIELPTNVYSVNLSKKKISLIQTEDKTPNQILMEKIMELSENNEYWEKIYIPFTSKDIFDDLYGNKQNEPIVKRKAGIILTNIFFQFILERKIKKKSSIFRISDFFDYIFYYNYDKLTIGIEHERAIENKLRIFLRFIAGELLRRLEIPEIIERKETNNEFKIVLRNTDTIIDRIGDIKKEIISYFSQKRIDEFY